MYLYYDLLYITVFVLYITVFVLYDTVFVLYLYYCMTLYLYCICTMFTLVLLANYGDLPLESISPVELNNLSITSGFYFHRIRCPAVGYQAGIARFTPSAIFILVLPVGSCK